MPINVTNETADTLVRKFAKIAGVSLTDAIVIACREAIERRQNAETPMETAAKLRSKHNITVSEAARKPLPKEAFDQMWETK
jgi:antitoxin VapB